VDNVFDKAKKETSKYIATTVMQQVIAAKTPEYIATLSKLVDDVIADPKNQAKIDNYIGMVFQKRMKDAVEQAVRKYFCSKEFKERCATYAKGLLKNADC
jgi:hypothetical protein